MGILDGRRLLVHVDHHRRLHLTEDVSNGHGFRDGVRRCRSVRILRESRGMITIDIVTDAGDGERGRPCLRGYRDSAPTAVGSTFHRHGSPRHGSPGRVSSNPSTFTRGMITTVRALLIQALLAPTKLRRDSDGGVADTILIGVLHRRDEDLAGTMAHRDHRDRPSGGLGTVGGLAKRHVRSAGRDALQIVSSSRRTSGCSECL